MRLDDVADFKSQDTSKIPDHAFSRRSAAANAGPFCRPSAHSEAAAPAPVAHCIEVCPTGALAKTAANITLDMGRCLFCGACARACAPGHLVFSANYQLAATRRRELLISAQSESSAEILCETARKYFGHSFKLRQVSAGGCNACEADANVFGTPAWDMGRFGIQFVASPRHADGLLVTGPVTQNMLLALEKTYAALPRPRLVIACGSCAIAGGPYIDHPEIHNGVASVVPVDLFVPGCPPHPLTLLDSLLRLIGRSVPDVQRSFPDGHDLV